MSIKLDLIKNPFPSNPDVALTDRDVVRSNVYDPQLRDFAIVARLKKNAGDIEAGGGGGNLQTFGMTIDPTVVNDQAFLVVPDMSVVQSIEITTLDPVTSQGPPTGIDFEVVDGLTLLQPPGYPNLSICPIYPTWEPLDLKPHISSRTVPGGGIRAFLSPYTIGTLGGPVFIRIKCLLP